MNPEPELRPALPSSIRLDRDIVFGAGLNEHGQMEPLHLDLYLPADDAAGLRPVIVWIHGGGFRPGNDKQQKYIVRLATEFAGRGYVGVAPDYRVRENPKADWRGTGVDAMTDIRAALAWVRAKASAYRIDPRRIALAGGSAGGMIMHNLCHDPVAPLDAARDGIFAAISLWGPPKTDTRLFERVNPTCPPTLFIHGTADALVPYHLSPDLFAELKAAGVAGELLTFEGAPHTPVMHMDEIIAAISGFLSDYLMFR